jgi:hypothetical protein
MRKLVECEHCGGVKQCRSHGGRSCEQCLLASGRRPKDWATVRCSFCGGRGRVWIVEEEAPAAEEASPADAPQETAEAE